MCGQLSRNYIIKIYMWFHVFNLLNIPVEKLEGKKKEKKS